MSQAAQDESPRRASKLSENMELVLTELFKDARSAQCISKQRALGLANGTVTSTDEGFGAELLLL